MLIHGLKQGTPTALYLETAEERRTIWNIAYVADALCALSLGWNGGNSDLF